MSRKSLKGVVAAALAAGGAIGLALMHPAAKPAPEPVPPAPLAVASAPPPAPQLAAPPSPFRVAAAPAPIDSSQPLRPSPNHPIPAASASAPRERVKLAGLMAQYRDAVCGCASKACVIDLQGRFVRQLGGADYDPQRDQTAYVTAMHQATACVAALP